jgi:hypothetical protein
MSFCWCLMSMPVSYFLFMAVLYCVIVACSFKGGYTLVTLPRILTPYRDNVDGTRDRVTYQKLVTR